MKNIASPGFEPTPVQSESSACTTGVMTISDTCVLKVHIETERQIFFSKIERHFARHMLAWGFGDFKGGEIFPWRNYPLRNCPRAKFPPPPCTDQSNKKLPHASSPQRDSRTAPAVYCKVIAVDIPHTLQQSVFAPISESAAMLGFPQSPAASD